jgi:hypothetical protein
MSLIGEGMELMKLLDKAKNADLYKQLGEWIDKVLDLQKRSDELTFERNSLREQLLFKRTLERINGHTFIQGEDEEICPSCAAVELRPVYLQRLRSKHPPYVKATCPACKFEMDHNVPYTREMASRNKQSSGFIG